MPPPAPMSPARSWASRYWDPRSNWSWMPIPRRFSQMIVLYVEPGHWNQRIGRTLHQECVRIRRRRRRGPGGSSFLRLCLAVPDD
jgi:hypothetical protein